MASFNLQPGANVGPSPVGNARDEASLAQAMVNRLAVSPVGPPPYASYVYDNVARTLLVTSSNLTDPNVVADLIGVHRGGQKTVGSLDRLGKAGLDVTYSQPSTSTLLVTFSGSPA